MPVGNLLSVSEAAKCIGCTGARVRQMLLAKELAGVKATESENGLWLIPREEVQKATERERRKGGRPRIGD